MYIEVSIHCFLFCITLTLWTQLI